MPFPKNVRIDALILCQRFCCLCNERKHTRITCHHIKQEADGGPNTLDNCIPLCAGCHSEVKAFDPRHNFGATSYSDEELIRRRDDWYAVLQRRSAGLEKKLVESATLYPHAEELTGRVEFDYESHNGFHRFGVGNSEFLLKFSGSSNSSIQVIRDGTNVSIALAAPGSNIETLISTEELDFSSRLRRPKLDEYCIAVNHRSRYAAFRLKEVNSRSHGHAQARVVLNYWILDDGTSDFSRFA